MSLTDLGALDLRRGILPGSRTPAAKATTMGPMTALELLTVLLAVLALIAAMALAWLCQTLFRLSRELSRAVAEFEHEAVPAIAELRRIVGDAGDEVARLEQILDISESIGSKVDSATTATYKVLTSPIIKGVAFASGTRKAAGRLRGTEQNAPAQPISRRGRSTTDGLVGGGPTLSVEDRDPRRHS